MQGNKDDYFTARILGGCVFIVCDCLWLYEALQILSQGWSYLTEFSNLLDITNQGVSTVTSVYTCILTSPNNALRG